MSRKCENEQKEQFATFLYIYISLFAVQSALITQHIWVVLAGQLRQSGQQ